MGKFIEFHELTGGEIGIFNKKSGDILGKAMYYSQWKQHIFVTADHVIWSWDCLQNIVNKLKELNEKGRAEK